LCDTNNGEKDKNGKETGNVVIKSHIYFYGTKAVDATAAQVKETIEKIWNNAQGTVKIGKKTYCVKVEITYDIVSQAEAAKKALTNGEDALNNFVRIESRTTAGNDSRMNGNSGIFIAENIGNGSTEVAHEWGHSLGWYDAQDAHVGLTRRGTHDFRGYNKEGVHYPGIMTPAAANLVINDKINGDLFKMAFKHNPLLPFSQEGLTNKGWVNDFKRVAIAADISKILRNDLLTKGLPSYVGDITNELYNNKGKSLKKK
jgi:hypothetical protein